jgi:hypothetical protein
MSKLVVYSQTTEDHSTIPAFLCAFAPLRENSFSQRRKGAKESRVALILLLILSLPPAIAGQQTRTLSGTILTQQNETVAGVSILVRSAAGVQRAESDSAGNFRLSVPAETLSLRFFGKKIALLSKTIKLGEPSENLDIRVAYVVPPVHESVVIEATALDPRLDRRNDTIYHRTLTLRDDQLFQTLNAGINAGPRPRISTNSARRTSSDAFPSSQTSFSSTAQTNKFTSRTTAASSSKGRAALTATSLRLPCN